MPDLLRHVLGHPGPVDVHHQPVRIRRVRQPSAGRLEQRVGALAQPEPQSATLAFRFVDDAGDSFEGTAISPYVCRNSGTER